MDSASASASANAANQTGPPISYLRPLMISMFGVVLTAIAILLYHFILAGVCKRRRMEAEAAMRSSSRQPIAGVDKKVLERIPIIKFSALTEGMDQEAECVVCLGEMEIEEMVRVLPTCRHAFHVTCVDEWLAGHVTCPLCRSPIEPGAGFDPKLFIPRNGSGGAALPLGVILPTERSGAAPQRLERSLSIDQSMIADLERGGCPSPSRERLRRSESTASISLSGMERRAGKWIPSFSRWRVVKGHTLPY